VPRQLVTTVLLMAGLLASGVQWPAVQTLGWAKMIVNHTRTMPLADAVRLTFSGEELCAVCELVQAAQDTERHPMQAATGTDKLLLAPAPPTALVVAAPEFLTGIIHEDRWAAPARAAPPVPPPRA
jgi:hypothetical protein